MEDWVNRGADQVEGYMHRHDPRLADFLQRGTARRAWHWRPWIWADKVMLRLADQPRLRLPRMRFTVPILCVLGFVTAYIAVAANTPDPPLNPCGAGSPSVTVLVGSSAQLGSGLVTAKRLPISTSQHQQSVTLAVPGVGQYHVTQINYGLGVRYHENVLVKGASITLLTDSLTSPGSGYQAGTEIKSLSVCWSRLKPKKGGKRLL